MLENVGLSYAGPPQDFNVALPIPPLLEGSMLKAGEKSLKLDVGESEMTFFPGYTTPTLGYNGPYLGPTIKVRNGENFDITVNNNLRQRTSVHWHGLHVPAEWDGGPRQEIRPGGTWNPRFTINQPAATLWYHPHAMGLTGEHAYMGLAGLFVIEDEVSDNLLIPDTYGVDDFPIVLQDRRFSTMVDLPTPKA